jgi:hypothetical protein
MDIPLVSFRVNTRYIMSILYLYHFCCQQLLDLKLYLFRRISNTNYNDKYSTQKKMYMLHCILKQ